MMLTCLVGFRQVGTTVVGITFARSRFAATVRPGDNAPMPSTANATDHELAAQLAVASARLLLDVRKQAAAAGADASTLRDRGDQASHELLMAGLAQNAPDDDVLSEEADDSRTDGDHPRLAASRVWIVDPLDGTREFGEPGRGDWAVHVALAIDGTPVAGAVALPAQGVVLGTQPAPPPLPPMGERPRIVVSRSRPPAVANELASRIGGDIITMGSAGAKAMAVVLGGADAYVHEGGQWEWDSAAPVAVAWAAGLHASRIDGTELRYNQPKPYLPDLLICRAELAEPVLRELAALRS